MKKQLGAAVVGALGLVASGATGAADVVRHKLLGGSTFPIARAVEVPAGKTIIFHSGTVPAPLDPKAEPGTLAYWGDTRTQALSTFARIKESLKTNIPQFSTRRMVKEYVERLYVKALK